MRCNKAGYSTVSAIVRGRCHKVSVFTHTIPPLMHFPSGENKQGGCRQNRWAIDELLWKQDIYDLCSVGCRLQTDLERRDTSLVWLLLPGREAKRHAQLTSGLKWKHDILKLTGNYKSRRSQCMFVLSRKICGGEAVKMCVWEILWLPVCHFQTEWSHWNVAVFHVVGVLLRVVFFFIYLETPLVALMFI